MSWATRWVLLAAGLFPLLVSLRCADAKDTATTGQCGPRPSRTYPASVGMHAGPAGRPASGSAHYVSAGTHRPRYVPQDKIRIVDGDTFRNGRERVRIIGYDAPEMSQPRGPAAKVRLTQLMRGGSVTMLRRGKDKYGRTLAFVYADGKNVAEIMKSEGFVKLRDKGPSGAHDQRFPGRY